MILGVSNALSHSLFLLAQFYQLQLFRIRNKQMCVGGMDKTKQHKVQHKAIIQNNLMVKHVEKILNVFNKRIIFNYINTYS